MDLLQQLGARKLTLCVQSIQTDTMLRKYDLKPISDCGWIRSDQISRSHILFIYFFLKINLDTTWMVDKTDLGWCCEHYLSL